MREPSGGGAGAFPVASYDEGLLVDYRWYDANAVAPAFPFGHGLTYTTFAYSDLVVNVTGGGGGAGAVVTVSARVTNSGTTWSGVEVAQLYLAFPEEAREPPRLLKGFQPTPLLGQVRPSRQGPLLLVAAMRGWECFAAFVGGSS